MIGRRSESGLREQATPASQRGAIRQKVAAGSFCRHARPAPPFWCRRKSPRRGRSSSEPAGSAPARRSTARSRKSVRSKVSRVASDAAANGSTGPRGPRSCGSCDQPCLEIDLPVERGGQPRAVGHHQETTPASRDQIARQRKNVIGRRFVEVAGGLVGQKQKRLCRQRTADRDPLLLAAGQLLGVTAQETAE